MKTIRRMKGVLVLVLIGWTCFLRAQVVVTETWSGDVSSRTYNENTMVTLTGTVTLKGSININDGVTLTILTNGTDKTINRGYSGTLFNNGPLFNVKQGSTLILGDSTARIIINGGAVYSLPASGPDAHQDATSTLTNNPYTGWAIFGNGNLEMNSVTIQQCYNPDGYGCAVLCFNDGERQHGEVPYVTMRDCIIKGINSGSGPALYSYRPDLHDITMTNTEIKWCYANATTNDAGGIINTNGGTKSSLVMDSCNIHDNKTLGNGGGVAWMAGGRGGISKLTLTNNTLIHDNVADRNGGGIDMRSTMDIQSARIYNNRSANGGGISLQTYDGKNDVYEGKGIDFIVSDGVYIYNNTATISGGGVHIHIYGSDDVGFNPSGNPINAVNVVKMTGGEIYGNTAVYGAGMAIEDNAPNKHYNSTYHMYSGEYSSVVNIQGGQIYDNYCDTLSAAVQGGGLYIRKYEDSSVNYGTVINPSTGETVTGGTVTINALDGLVYNNKARNTIYDGVGGGMFINNEIPQAPYNGVCNINIGGNVKFYDNTSDGSGAGIYIANGNVIINGGTIGMEGHPNIAFNGNGAGVAIVNGNLTVNSGNVDYNVAGYSHNQGGNGGAIYLTGGIATINGGTVSNNYAEMNGGGFYVSSDSSSAVTTISNGAKISGNEAHNGFGGGFYLNSGILNISGDSTVIKGNHAYSQGGGIYVGGGTFTMTGGTIGGTTVDGNYTTNGDSYGGGIFMGNGTATITNSTISGNYTYSRTNLNGCGGAIYMNGGSCTLSNGANLGGTAPSYANTSKYGGAVYSANGIITVEGGIIGYNNAEKGGGIYANGDNAKVYVQKNSSKADALSYIEHNTAQYGGGIYGEKGRVEFSDGYIRYNTASEQGGGIYVDANDTLYLKGSANMFLNGVPTGHKGGGVYLIGSIIVGEQALDLDTIMVQDNYAYTTARPDTLASSTVHVATNLRNNVFLPNPVVHTYTESTHAGVIEVVENGISNASRVGFSVPHGNVPVIYCTRSGSSWDYLHNFSTGQPLQFNLFDDSGRFRSVQYSNDPNFDPDHVYLFGFWSDEVTGGSGDYCSVDVEHDFEGQDTVYIYTPCQLAFFISWVNGRETPIHIDSHPNAKAKLMDDIDMSEFVWVPIGNGVGYGGVFDGNGHTVTGLRHLLNDTHTNYGFFGKLVGSAVVKNLFLKGEHFHIEKKLGYDGTLYLGGVAGLTSGNTTIENCESSSVIIVDPNNPNTVMGGLVGKTHTGDLISSSIGIADMSGFLMGGLAGQNGGQLFNSFANAKFTSNGTQYLGGLAGENTGTIENCYTRLSGAEPDDTKNFGYLVGNNTGGYVNYCYSPVDTCYFKTNGGTVSGSGHYDDNAIAPRLYRHRDTQVTISTDIVNVNTGGTDNRFVPTGVDQQLMLCLERWVDTMNIKHSGHYAHWDRTTTKVINNDLPILKMDIVDGHETPIVNAVYCTGNPDGTENETYINYGEVNNFLATQRQAGESIWLYKSKAGINGNKGSNAKLYIDEGVTVIQNDSLYAYVGVTLDNSANINGANPTFGYGMTDSTDWHMFATPLANAPLGVDYASDATQWPAGDYSVPGGHPDGMPYYRFYDDADHRGYFPSYKYGEVYSNVNTSATVGGNYYQEWDFYTYYEPEYHWINFKRNSNSHWHQNAPNIPIEYTHYDSETGNTVVGNETYLTRGRGYLLATREETFLQCYGLLNGTSGQVSIPVTYSGYYSPGYNFLGNPYLAYLDFDKFAQYNAGLWAADTLVSYAIIDEDEGGYIYHAVNASVNPNTAGPYIAPHQGFMILTYEGVDDDATADFYSEGIYDMRKLTVSDGKFRNDINYPLVNLIATDDNGNRDIATVELGRPDRGGAPLMRELRQCKGHVWCHYEGNDWAIAFTRPGLSEAAIRFETYEDGEYTMRWNTQNGDFSYLHLIDNLTGADIDCLATDEYHFTSTTTDFKSRFRLVFGYTGIEEPEADEPAEGNFAYQSGDALVVTGEGLVELFDVTGRRMATQCIEGVQGTMSVSGLTSGVYLLRLATASGTRVQKIVINQ